MLCGCGSSGKSTFGKYLVKTLSQAKLISMDEIVKQNQYNYHKHYQNFINLISYNIKLMKYQYIIIDFSNDSIYFRKKILNDLKNNSINLEFNFVTISMRPGINNIFLWDEQRTKKTLNENEKKMKAFKFQIVAKEK